MNSIGASAKNRTTAPDEKREREKAAAVKRSRESRARQKRGERSGRIIYHEYNAAEALILSGRLDEAQALRRDLVERELAGVLREWTERWLPRPE